MSSMENLPPSSDPLFQSLDFLNDQNDENLHTNLSTPPIISDVDQVVKRSLLFANKKEFESGKCDVFTAKTFYANHTFTEGPLQDEDIFIFPVTQEEGQAPVIHYPEGMDAALLERDLHIHYSNNGTEEIQILEHHHFTIESMDKDEYRKIFNIASLALLNIAQQYQSKENHADSKDENKLSDKHFTIQTHDKSQHGTVTDTFSSKFARTDPQNAIKAEQHRDELDKEEDDIRREHVKQRDEKWEQRQEINLKNDILKAEIMKDNID